MILYQPSLNDLPFIFPPPLLYKLLLSFISKHTKNKLGKWIILSCKIHMVEEETLNRGPKGGGKEELGEEE